MNVQYRKHIRQMGSALDAVSIQPHTAYLHLIVQQPHWVNVILVWCL